MFLFSKILDQIKTNRRHLNPLLLLTLAQLVALGVVASGASQHQHQQQHQQPVGGGGGQSSQRESLRRTLNESLNHFLQMANRQHQQRHQQQQRPQQQQQQQHQQLQRAASKEISCDELSLVVLAQRVLNMNASSSAINRLIECQPIAATLNNDDHNNNDTAKEMMEPQFIRVPDFHQSSAGFHLGAKISLSLLALTILLVATATLFDIYTGDNAAQRKAAKWSKCETSNNNHEGGEQRLRDKRSPSVSSSCSSSLFCSANSVASSSAPILSTSSRAHQHHHHQQQQQQQTGKSRPCGQTSTRSHYGLNLQMHFDEQQASHSTGAADHGKPIDDQQQRFEQLFTPTPSNHWYDQTAAAPRPHHQISVSPAAVRTGDSFNEADHRQLVKQLLLAFSLRQSVRQIFQVSNKSKPPAKAEAPAMSHHVGAQEYISRTVGSRSPMVGHRSRLSSLSSVNTDQQHTVNGRHFQDLVEQEQGSTTINTELGLDHNNRGGTSQEVRVSATDCCTVCSANWPADQLANLLRASPTMTSSSSSLTSPPTKQKQHKQQQQRKQTKESIDSLHGLRFLSMIWVIVIHSYNFALRWMFFTNTTTIEGLYKTVASQLLANGSFACDSFFFAGGFLLSYLALPDHQMDQQQQQHEASHMNNNNNNKQHQEEGPEAAVTNATGAAVATIEIDKSHCGGGGGGASPPRSTSSSPALQEHEEEEATSGNLLTVHQHPVCACQSSRSQHKEQQLGAPQQQQQQQRQAQQLFKGDAKLNTNELMISQSRAKKRKRTLTLNTQTTDNNPNEQQCFGNFYNIKQTAATATTTKEATKESTQHHHKHELSFKQVLVNILHRYVRMMPLMMAIIGLSATLLRYLGDGPSWDDSTMMYDKWCRKNWWINLLFLHNFINRENMCLSHSWYSAVDLQLFLLGQLILYCIIKSKRLGSILLIACLSGSLLMTATLTLVHHLPAVPLVSSVSEQTMNLYYGEIYIKPYCRASPYLIGILLAYLMRTTSLGQLKLTRLQVVLGWLVSLTTLITILLIMQPAMNGHSPSELQSALYSALSRPLWACAIGWIIFACMTNQGGPIEAFLSAPCFVPFSRLTYPAFLIHPIVMAIFYGSRQSSFHFSHYLMLYLTLGNIVITYACAFVLAALVELPLLSVEQILKRQFWFKFT